MIAGELLVALNMKACHFKAVQTTSNYTYSMQTDGAYQSGKFISG